MTMEAVFTPQQDAAEQRQVLQLQGQADEDWWLPGHPGWAIWPADSDQFLHQVQQLCSSALKVAGWHPLHVQAKPRTRPTRTGGCLGPWLGHLAC